VPLTPDAALAGGALLAGPATALVDVAVAGADGAGAAGSGWLWGCDPADWPGAAGPPPWATPWTVWLTLASAPPAGDWPGPPLGVPDGACPGGVLTAAAPAAGPVLWPPDPPGKMSWVTPLTADTPALAAGVLAAGVLAAGAGTWFAPPLAAGAAGGGTLAAGAAGEEAALAAGAWLAGPGWPAELGWPAGAGCGGAGGWPAGAGAGLPPLPGAGVLPGPVPAVPVPAVPGRRLWAVPATEPAAEVTLPGRPAVTPPRPAAAAEGCAEPGFCAAPGFWLAEARPARSTAQTSAAARPPHAYRQTLRASSKARERVADPSTANTLPPDPDNDPYPRQPPHPAPPAAVSG
jgi:hypothetical protein